MKKKFRFFFRNFFLCILALGIPGFLVINGIQSSKYRTLKKEVEALEKKQEFLIEENKKLITDISLLSSSDRIEKIAEEDLGMRPAESEEIVRVGVPGTKEKK